MIDTLERAKNDLRQGWKTSSGSTCPCCGQNVKLYPRSISAKQTYMLCVLSRLCRGNDMFFHRSQVTDDNSGDLAKMAFWGLIEEGVNSDSSKKNSGYWRITQKGTDFANGDILIPKTVFIYNKSKREESKALVSIHDTWAAKFNYGELLGRLL